MAFPTLTASLGLTESSSASGNRNVTVPTVATGDLLLCHISSDGNPTFTGTLITNMTGLVAKAASSTVVTSQVLYRKCDGSESGATWVLSLSASEACCVMWAVVPASTWHGTTMPEAIAFVVATTLNPNPPSITPSWGAADTLYITWVSWDNGPITVSAYPTNYTDDNLRIAGNISSTGIAIATRSLNATPPEDPGTFTLSGSEETLSTTIAVRPSAAAGNNKDGTLTATGGGVIATPSGSKAATRAQTLTGGGVLTTVRSKGATRATTQTGGGIYTSVRSKAGSRALGSLTGGGVHTSTRRKGGQTAHTETGGGVVTLLSEDIAGGPLAITGGGAVALPTRSGGHAGGLTATGGGSVTFVALEQASTLLGLTGAGSVTFAAEATQPEPVTEPSFWQGTLWQARMQHTEPAPIGQWHTYPTQWQANLWLGGVFGYPRVSWLAEMQFYRVIPSDEAPPVGVPPEGGGEMKVDA